MIAGCTALVVAALTAAQVPAEEALPEGSTQAPPATAPAASAPPAPAPAPVTSGMRTPAKGTVVVGRSPVPGAKKGTAFEISVGDCKVAKGAPKGTPADCAIYVGLGKGRRERLEWTAKPGTIFPQGERSVGIGDEADTAIGISWAPIQVAKDVHGVVVTLQSGGERVKHRHDAFLSYRGKLRYAFTASEPRGPMTWSSVTPLDMDGNGAQELLLMHAARPDEEQADKWQVEVYGWRADVAKIVKLPSWAPTIHAAIVGTFYAVKDAREAQDSKCLREFIVVDHTSAPLLQENSYAVLYPAATAGDADLALEAAKACDDDITGAIKIVSRGMDVVED